MSKASEWGKAALEAQHIADSIKDDIMFRCASPHTRYGLEASPSLHGKAGVQLFLDRDRGDSPINPAHIFLDVPEALALARWILDTFGETP